MALKCTGTFKGGIYLEDVYVKILIVATNREDFWHVVFRAYHDKSDATNNPDTSFFDSFIFEFPANRNSPDLYAECYERLKSGDYILDRLKYTEGNMYENTQYFPTFTSMEDA